MFDSLLLLKKGGETVYFGMYVPAIYTIKLIIVCIIAPYIMFC
jgi:hypothetical protein